MRRRSTLALWIMAAALALASPAAAQRQEDRFNDLERLITQLTGQVERLQHQNTQLQQSLERLQSDYDFRLQALEGKGGARPPAGRPAAPPPGGADPGGTRPLVPPPNTAGLAPVQGGGIPLSAGGPLAGPEQTYNDALDALGRNDYAAAERGLRDFIARHPQHALAGNAHYWLGETHYGRKDFGTAGQAFATAYKSYPRSVKAPDSLLKLGMSLQAQGKSDQACTVYGQLGQLFPGASDIVKRRVVAERQRSRCA